MKYDLIVIGSGPGGYVAALRGAQCGMKVAIIEREALGGVCLNFGCIPTKALLQSAHVCEAVRSAAEYGIVVERATIDFPRVIERSREVAASMSKGVQFLLNKAKVEVVYGEAKFVAPQKLSVTQEEGKVVELEGARIVIATGARSRQLPNLPIDGKYIIGYREALTQTKRPDTLAVIGSGAIGAELALFYKNMGAEVVVIEALPRLVPLEDDDVSSTIGRAFRKAKIKTMVGTKLLGCKIEENTCVLSLETTKGIEELRVEQVLSAVGIQANIENLGLEALGIETERGRIKVDAHYQTNVASIYAIGDVIPTIALAHVASAEAVACINYMVEGDKAANVNYDVVPACTYTTPEIGSVGLRERQAKEQGIEYIVGNFPFTASGKATAMGARDGFVKLLFEAKTHKLIGAHIVGASATEMIAELALAMQMEVTAETLHHTIHPHPTLSEAVMEAAAQALAECVHL